MNDDLEVIIDEPTRGSTVLTPFVAGNLRTRAVDPGGYGSAEFDLAREIDAPSFEDNSAVTIYDAETAEVVNAGVLRNPGRTVSARGGVWKVSTVGAGPVYLHKHHGPYHLIDTRLDDGTWWQGFRNSSRFEFNNAAHPDDEDLPGWLFTTPEGRGWAQTHGCSLNYYDIKQYGLAYGAKIGGFSLERDCGRATSSQILRGILLTYDGTASNEEVLNVPWVTTPTSNTRQVTDNWAATGIGPFDDDHPVRLILRIERSGADVVEPPGALSTDWAHLAKLRVSAIRVDRNGNEIVASGSYSAKFLLAHEVIIDSWARFCPELDVVNARIDDTSVVEYRDLVWPDGVDPYGVIDRLMEREPAFTWGVWERKPTGLWRAEWRERDLDVRYVLTESDPVTETGTPDGPLDRVYTAAQNWADRYRINFEDANDWDGESVPRAKTIKFSDGKLDDTDFNVDAIEQAQAEIAQSRLRGHAARADVSRKIYDRFAHRWVKPSLILPGYNIQVPRGLDNDVYRIVSNEYSADNRTAQLELDNYTFDEQRAIAALLNVA